MQDKVNLTGLSSDMSFRFFFEDLFPECSSCATFSFPLLDFLSADTYIAYQLHYLISKLLQMINEYFTTLLNLVKHQYDKEE